MVSLGKMSGQDLLSPEAVATEGALQEFLEVHILFTAALGKTVASGKEAEKEGAAEAALG